MARRGHTELAWVAALAAAAAAAAAGVAPRRPRRATGGVFLLLRRPGVRRRDEHRADDVHNVVRGLSVFLDP